MTVAKIHGAEFPVCKIFSNDFNFKIPLYQRPYSWTTEQAGELIDDLISFIGSDASVNIDELSPYFLGSIVLIKQENHPNAEVVDGQQRLTTLTILLSALRQTIETQSHSQEITGFLYEKGSSLVGTPNRYRLKLRERDEKFFCKYVQSENQVGTLPSLNAGQLSDAQQNIRANAILFLNKLEKLSEAQRIRLAQFIIMNCFLVVVSTPDLDSAYRIFSILNDRGLDLSHSDILKSEVIGRIKPPEDQELYNEKWEDAEEELGRESFSDLFAHTRTIYCKIKAKGTILKEFREFVIKPVVESRTLIDDVLIPFADAFTTIQAANYESTAGAEQVNEMLKWLGRIDNTDWIPPAILFMARNKSDAQSLFRFFADLERLAAFLMNCRYGINERIERYGKLLDAIEHGVDLYATDSPLQLSDSECSLFVKELNGDLYHQVPKRRLYVLLRLDSALSDGSASYDHAAISIEHVLPQNPPASSEWCEWFPTQELRDLWVHRLGNLLLLNHKKNSSASNYEFDKKKKAYFTKGGVSPFPLTTQALGESEWTLEVVERRQKKALEQLKKVWRIKADLPVDETEYDVEDEAEDDDTIETPESKKPGKDYTKLDVTINGVKKGPLPKRKAMLIIIKHLCEQGVTPDEIMKLVPWRKTMLRSINGTLSSLEFIKQQEFEQVSGNKIGYFCDDSELIHSLGKTYAVSNSWGHRAFQAIQNILAKFPDKGVTCEKHCKNATSVEKTVTRNSWQNHPMLENRRRIAFHRTFSEREFAKIKSGHIPEAMEDRWFVFFEDGWAYFHRSWTGHCIFQVKLKKVDGDYRVEEAWVNQDRSQYESSGDEGDIEMLTNVFQWSLGI